MRTVTSKLFEFLKRKLNEMNHIKCISDVFVSVKCKLVIRDEFEINWHKLPKSSMRKLNKADCTEYINSMITLMKCKLIT